MIGNRTGWMISGGIFVVAGLIGMSIALPRVFNVGSGPTSATLAPGVLDLWMIDAPISSILDTAPAGGGNAGDDYHRAIRLLCDKTEEIDEFEWALKDGWRDARELLDRAEYEPVEDLAEQLEAISVKFPPVIQEIIQHLTDAAGKEKMEYVFVHTAREFEVRPDIDAAGDFFDMGKLLMAISDYHMYRNEPAKAVPYMQLMAVMGWHMFNEHGHVDMMYNGLAIQLDATKMLQQLYYMMSDKDAERKRANEYQRAVDAVESRFRKKREAVMPKTGKAYPGDVFKIVRDDADRAWRIQTILELGQLKFQGIDRNDLRIVHKLIKESLASDDERIRAAATAARDWTGTGADSQESPEQTE